MNRFFDLVLGTTDYVTFAASVFFALIGVAFFLLMHSAQRDPLDQRSPIPFSISFLLTDNLKRIATGIILVFIFLRFSEYYLGAKLSLVLSFIIGASCDKLGKIVQNKLLK